MNRPRFDTVRSRLVGSTVLAVLSVPTTILATPASASAPPSPRDAAVATAALDDTEGQGRLMLVLDSSGSMAEPAGGGGSKIAAAKSALRTLVNELPDEAEVGLRVFGAKVFSRTDPGSCEDTQQVVEPGTETTTGCSAPSVTTSRTARRRSRAPSERPLRTSATKARARSCW